MSESFSDIWASSNPVKSQQPQSRTLGVAANNLSTVVAVRSTPDAFSMLASAGAGPSRPITPSIKHSLATSNIGTTGDAFGGLVSFGNSTSRDGGLTIAERAAKAERERKERTEKEEVTFSVHGSFWDKYEGLSEDKPPVPDAKMKSNDLLDLDFLNEEMGEQVDVIQTAVKERKSRQPQEEMGEEGGVTQVVVEERKSRRPRESFRTTPPSGLQRQGSSRATTPPAHTSPLLLQTESPSTNQQGLQEQADKLLNQASAIGMTMFSKANTFWKESREKVAKAYEEQSSGTLGTARRRRPPAATSTSKAPAAITTPTALPLLVRLNIAASPSTLAASGTNKVAGNEHFKLGRFAEAEAAYSHAIDALPASHLLRIPLCNNRALTRLKTGDYKGTVVDTSEVLRIIAGDIGIAWHPGREEVDIRKGFVDAMGKALRRRAEAYEGLEKWKEATGDWEWLGAAAWVGATLKGDAAKGLGRCRQMAREGSNPVIAPQTTSRLKHNPHSTATRARVPLARPSEALTRLRAANTAQEKEDQSRHDLKDLVDARVTAWRTGKENNLRALIASLDVVLSSTFEWQPIGMSELVSPRQVKVQYTKAIAKLHPDKLNNDTTLEEQMTANSVFGTLNEAWNAFR